MAFSLHNVKFFVRLSRAANQAAQFGERIGGAVSLIISHPLQPRGLPVAALIAVQRRQGTYGCGLDGPRLFRAPHASIARAADAAFSRVPSRLYVLA